MSGGRPICRPIPAFPDPETEVEAIRRRQQRGYRGGGNGGIGQARADVWRALKEIDRLRAVVRASAQNPNQGETDGE